MEINSLISVIIPVFNAERFLDHTIPSVLNQNYSSLEIILVNDGSTDKSLEICKKYEGEDSRIKVIDIKNLGANPARGKGVENATGDYVYFMDADDTIAPHEIRSLYTEIGNADMLMSGSQNEFRFNRIEYIKALINHQIPLRLCGHMYRRSILDQKFFNTPRDLKMGEDMLSNLMIAQNVNLFMSIKYTGYVIDGSNANSISRGFVRSVAYEKKFDDRLSNILSKYIDKSNFNRLVALQRFKSLQYLLIEDKNMDLNDEFVKQLFDSGKFLSNDKFRWEKIVMNIRPLSLSAFLLRKVLLFKRKFLK